MWQRFTEQARRVIMHGAEEAVATGATHVETEHLLLGLMRERDDLAAQILEEEGIAEDRLRATIAFFKQGHTAQHPESEPKLTLAAKGVLELAADESRRMRCKDIGTEHLLLALMRQTESMSAIVLHSFGLNLTAMRQTVKEHLSAPSSSGQDVHAAGQQKSVAPSQETSYDRLLQERDARIHELEQELKHWRLIGVQMKNLGQLAGEIGAPTSASRNLRWSEANAEDTPPAND